MSGPKIDEAFVREAAKLVGIEVDAESMPGVIANLERIAGFASMLEEVPLGAEDEMAPVWRA